MTLDDFKVGELATIASDDHIFGVHRIKDIGPELIELETDLVWRRYRRLDGRHPLYTAPSLRAWAPFDETRVQAQRALREACSALACNPSLEQMAWTELKQIANAFELAADLKRWNAGLPPWLPR
jgi:hypothetical protein